MRTTIGWSDYHPVLGQLDDLLASARPIRPQPIGEWADDVRLAVTDWSSEALHAMATQILSVLPYDLLRQQIVTNDGSAEMAENIRFSRKFILTARDSLVLGVANIQDPGFNPLFVTARQLGKIADSTCSDAKEALQAIDTLAAHAQPIATLHSDATLTGQVTEIFDEVITPLQTDEREVSPKLFHRHRKHLRRVVHVAMEQAIIEPSDHNVTLAQQGIAINREIGAIKDVLLATGNVVSETD
ncbi:hypothetical protein KDA23_06465 [Candidatus Saccharibacteria bacterium]|nr:hypothetical protein [Candidatus Saccharibacteria bacterium]